MNINGLIDALQNLINTKVTQSEIAKILGKERQNISRKAKAGTELKLSDIRKIENYFNVKLITSNHNDYNNDNNEDFLKIPVRGEVYASMGSGITIYDETQTGTYKISRELARDIGVNLSNTEMIFAKGDSMEPTIIGGDSLLIDLSKKEVYDGSIYCVRIEGQLYAKRLQKIPPNTVKIISDNKEKYDPIYIDFSKGIDFDFAVIGEIRWWGRVAR